MEAAESLEYELQKEVSNIMIQNYITSLRQEFETKLWENQNRISAMNKNWKEKISSIAALRDELGAIFSVVSASESGVLSSHGSLERIEELNFLKMKDDNESQITEKTTDSEWLKLRRQHESELHEKTEELFRLKREFAKDRSLLPFRMERELEVIKSKLLQSISKLDEITSREDNPCCDNYDNDGVCRFKDRIGSLLHKNEHLQGLLADKRMVAKHLSLQVLDAESKIAQHSLSELKLVKQVDKLRHELEDLKIERHLQDLLELSILREVFGNYENQIDESNQEETFLRKLLTEKEEQLSIVYDDRQKLKYENNQLVAIAGSTLMQHHEQVNLVNDELTIFREKVCEQELLILESKSESNSMKSCLYEALQQINVCKHEIHGLTDNLTSMSIALEEAKEQNASLDATIREMKKASVPSINNHKGQADHLEYALVSMEKLSKAYSDFEIRLAQSMKRNENRLTSIICQFNPLVQQVAVLKKKEFWYKQILEIKCSNLQKAEAEVDILGDEVDALLSILGKIYIALDHYSPVLKHYPGVTEIMKLVQKALKGEKI
ncbi:WPP domain-associated protein-like isoform X2 [Oryza brachyantha]|uniref:WPP domain-associated protein-like isoform X2 n=1 Tax=Oryza brachyantha TaxID=4533 RepID=UPI0003EA89D0|nr:WPP domain-associated protein-like isoform X2 [Oryza brachyantha]